MSLLPSSGIKVVVAQLLQPYIGIAGQVLSLLNLVKEEQQYLHLIMGLKLQ